MEMNDELSTLEFIRQHLFDEIEIPSLPPPSLDINQPDCFIAGFEFLDWKAILNFPMEIGKNLTENAVVGDCRKRSRDKTEVESAENVVVKKEKKLNSL
ncbi:hypothetical protein L1987_09387 [Smallanthus sonchifolius]|uniref:Uncharacterized protein n=1 Tax=Smallanthus sonchifolius TaxID=185202 RepID=A0ACB9JMU2_9ASTR|nr:hypothetical protein L1987_09387 [Smallanthus sonchifolius]